ncbi:exonuclease SbcCD subunit D [Chloroflexota bacterium]
MSDTGKTPLRILHTSDLHLALLGDKECHSLETVVDAACQAKVDLVIIAGDLFDHNRVDDNVVSFAVEQLRRLPMYVAILPGNHDCLTPNSPYERTHLWQDCANVQIFRSSEGEMLDLPGLGLSLWGRAFDSYEGDFLPLVGIPQPEWDGQWHIAVAHGYHVGDDPPLFPSFHITHKEIVGSGWDYIALGHLITFKCVSDGPVKAFYSGSPSASGAVAVVDLSEETGVQVSRCSLWDGKSGIV